MVRFNGKRGDGSISFESENNLFDSSRYYGDRELAGADNLKKIYKSSNSAWIDETILWRPEKIDEAIKWIVENIVAENQKRLIDAMELMRNDQSLYFYNSY